VPQSISGPAFGAAPGSGGLPGWVIGLIACAVAAPVIVAMVGILAAIAIPNFIKYQSRSKQSLARANLTTLWTAEQAYAKTHDGDFAEFQLDSSGGDDGYKELGVSLDKVAPYTYEGFYDDQSDAFYITADGKLDSSDDSEDKWELSSADGLPVHLNDGITHLKLADPKSPGEADQSDGGTMGGVVGGLGLKGTGGTGTGQGIAPEDGGTDVVTAVDPAEAKRILEIDEKALTAKANLEAIFEKEKKWKASHKAWLAFAEGDSKALAKLGVKLPKPAHHRFSATLDAGKLVLTASGNLDDDPFLDEWKLDSSVGVAVQTKNDAFDIDMTQADQTLAGGDPFAKQ